GGEHLLLVREPVERLGVHDARRDAVYADPARREVEAEIANDRLERRLRGADEDVVREDALRAQARDRDDGTALLHLRRGYAREGKEGACVRIQRPVPVLVLRL